jgi:hypothetical protein
MSLYNSKSTEKSTTKLPKQVYKHLYLKEGQIEDIEKLQLLTPFHHMPIKIGETYTVDLIKKEYDADHDIIISGLHSFTSLRRAITDMMEEAVIDDFTNNRVITLCEIPKNAEYYQDSSVIASTTLKYVKVIAYIKKGEKEVIALTPESQKAVNDLKEWGWIW